MGIRIIENLLIIYYLCYFLIDWLFFLIFLAKVKREKCALSADDAFAEYPVSVLVPAYNEEVTIVASVQMLLALDYPDYEVIVINDGSGDGTLSTLMAAFEPRKIAETRWQRMITDSIVTQPVKDVYTAMDGKLIIIDKVNGGKADAINVGINLSQKPLVCTIDADSVLDNQALKQTVQPMVDDATVFVSGGQLAVANGVSLKNNRVVNSVLPKNPWVQWQIIEYMKSFMIARYSMSKLNSIMIMSGAFSVYKRTDLSTVGGFLTQRNTSPYIREIGAAGRQTVCEDMEIVVRLWRYFYSQGKKARAVFLPHPVCWTEVPDNPGFLLRQRNRWHRGLAETLKIHRSLLFDPAYRAIGLFAYPYYLFFELLAPIIKIGTVGFLLYAGINGYFNKSWMLLATLFASAASALITCLATIFVEQWTSKKQLASYDALRYKTGWDWLRLVLMSIWGGVVYAPFRIYAQIQGLKDFLIKKNEWYKFARTGFGDKEEN